MILDSLKSSSKEERQLPLNKSENEVMPFFMPIYEGSVVLRRSEKMVGGNRADDGEACIAKHSPKLGPHPQSGEYDWVFYLWGYRMAELGTK